MSTPLTLPAPTSQIPGPAEGPLLLKSDGIHWFGSFHLLIDALIRDLLPEGPFDAQFTFDAGDTTDAPATYSAQIVGYNPSMRVATTADGVRILVEDLIAFAV